MCKQCELRGINMILFPLDRDIINNVAMPQSWNELEERGLDDDLILRARAHMTWMNRSGNPMWIANAKAFLSAMAKGFLTPFNRSEFEPQPKDQYFSMKRGALDALDVLSFEFRGRVSSVMWDSLAHLATRSEPEEMNSILKEVDLLPHHFGIVDTMYHAEVDPVC